MNENTKSETIRNCETCRFSEVRYAPPPSIEKLRVCRRFPPIPVMIHGPQGVGQMSVFPMVTLDAWCYEWQANNGPAIIHDA